MRTILHIAAVTLAVFGSTHVVLAQSSPGHAVVTGSEANEEELFGPPEYFVHRHIFMREPHHHRSWHHTHSR